MLPVALSGVDTVAMARTGSGKTCAFLIPLLETLLNQNNSSSNQLASMGVRGVILSPTRELSVQTLKVFYKLASDTQLKAIGIHGGEGMEKQFSLLASKPDVIIATPGRLAHHLTEIPDFTLSCVRMCILDEADRLLEMGFASQIRQITKTIPESCQKLLFSATLPRILVEFTKSGFCTNPTMVRLDQEATVSEELRIAFITCRSSDKDAALLHLLESQIYPTAKNSDKEEGAKESSKPRASIKTGLTLIFAATRHHVEFISTLLQAAGHDCTMIYGTLDSEARRINLGAFRSGQKPILVVTDVAARGIDVPLIDHVIHYNFPASPKLFVHRSGRAARAGRIGFCWGLVEPDELPYMIDLHLFLGRKPSTGSSESEQYALADMTPDMVHYGSVPETIITEEVENVQRILNSELSGSQQAEALRALTKVCNNAMKQYRKTRAEPSRDAIRRAKAILEGERMVTGQRLGGGSITTHPLLRGTALARQKKAGDGLGSIENSLKREEFLRAMSNFRPKETVFEAFATGGGKEIGVVSHVDKGRTTAKSKHDSSAALEAMRDMRRQMRISRDKGSTLMVAGSAIAEEVNNGRKKDESQSADGDEEYRTSDSSDNQLSNMLVESTQVEHKPRMSRAERKKLKKSTSSIAANSASSSKNGQQHSLDSKPAKQKRGTDFRDPNFYIDTELSTNPEEALRSRRIEAAMQPSAETSGMKNALGHAMRLEEAILDIVGDENEEMVKKHRMMRWDKSKRKYVQTTLGEELKGESKSKKMRLESGQLVRDNKAKLGELYVKWQKKTNRSVGRSGVFDDGDGPIDPSSLKRTTKGGGKDEIKSATAIKKERAKKQNLKIKNMKRGDRKAMERSQREAKAHAAKKKANAFPVKAGKKKR